MVIGESDCARRYFGQVGNLPHVMRHGIVKKVLLFLLFAGAVLAGILVWSHFSQNASLTEKSVTFASIQFGNMADVVSATGVIQPRETFVVSTEVPGIIKEPLARVNDTVLEGAVLAGLDDARFQLKVEEADNGVRTAQAALTQAEAALAAAEIGLKTQIDLAAKGGFRSERDQAEAQTRAARAGVKVAEARLRVAQTGLKEAKLALEQTQIKVPESSVSAGSRREFLILDRQVQVGQMVGPQGSPLFTLAGDLASMEIHAQIAEGDINKVKKGLVAVFTLSGFGDDDLNFQGIVKEIRPLAVNVKGAVYYDAVIDVPNRKDADTGEWRLRPGMTASIDVIRREHKDVWKVPTPPSISSSMKRINPSRPGRGWPSGSCDPITTNGKHCGPGTPPPASRRLCLSASAAPRTANAGSRIAKATRSWNGSKRLPKMRRCASSSPRRLPAPGLFDQPANIKVS